MNSPRVISHAGLTLNLATVKCIKLSIFDNNNKMIIEFKKRYDYIQHPNTGEFEKQEYNEQTEIEFPDYEIAKTYKDELDEIWQDYLDDQA
jgi:hypothetical protein